MITFIKAPLRAAAIWQNHRPVWLLMGLTALGMEFIGWGFFQRIQGFLPCEMCVYIRFSMLLLFFASIFPLINPRLLILRIIAYIISAYALIKGWVWDLTLARQHVIMQKLKEGADIFSLGNISGSCSMEPAFPFGLPLDKWFPSMFQPTAICGDDPWRFLGFNMAECLFIFYAIYSVLCVLFIIATIKYFNKVKGL